MYSFSLAYQLRWELQANSVWPHLTYSTQTMKICRFEISFSLMCLLALPLEKVTINASQLAKKAHSLQESMFN